MTLPAAYSRIVAIVEAVTPSSDGGIAGNLRRKFKHTPQASDDSSDASSPKTGAFWLEPTELHAVGAPISPSYPARTVVVLSLCVAYEAVRDGSKSDLALLGDYAAITAAIGNPAQWLSSSSGIVNVGAEGESMFSASIDKSEGVRVLRISFPIEVQS